MSSNNNSNEQLHSKDLVYENEGEENQNFNEEYDDMNEPKVEGEISLTNFNNQFDECISELKRQLQLSKELRKKSEVDAKALEHRIILLKNQEKYVMLQFQNTKKKIEQILINRAQSKERMMQKSASRRRFRTSDSYSLKKSKTSPSFKNIKNSQSEANVNNAKQNQLSAEKEKMKNDLIEKIKKDEEERKRLEKEIADIEQEEFRMLQLFSNS